MAEDGAVIDKLLLSTSAGYVPSGLGPDESPRSNGVPAASQMVQTSAAMAMLAQQEATATTGSAILGRRQRAIDWLMQLEGAS